MKKLYLIRHEKSFILSILLFLMFISVSPARAGNTPVTVSDLDEVINSLPRRSIVDHVSTLVARLNVLDSSRVVTPEHAALSQALALIRLMRTIRLSTAPVRPSTSLPLFAYATDSKSSNGCRLDK